MDITTDKLMQLNNNSATNTSHKQQQRKKWCTKTHVDDSTNTPTAQTD